MTSGIDIVVVDPARSVSLSLPAEGKRLAPH
jgi:hypothetical protein